jgi:hypothetical protein
MNNANFNQVNITTIDGKIVLDRKVEMANKTKIDISNYANGVYIVTITSNDGQLFTEKLIKN